MNAHAEPWRLAFAPRAWQAEAVEAWARAMRGIAAVVTGGGKTALAQMCMLRFLEVYPRGQFVIIVPTHALLDQWHVSFREDLGVPSESIATYSGEGRPRAPATVNLMVLNTARSLAPSLSSETDTFLIVDECHRSASVVNSKALDGTPRATLGLSATPEREYDDLFETTLVQRLGPVIYRYDYIAALRDSVIVPFDVVNVAGAMTDDERVQYDSATADIGRTTHLYQQGLVGRDILERKLRHRARLSALSMRRIPLAIILAERNRGKRILIFHESIQFAEAIQKILTSKNFNATIYHSKISPEVRRDNLRLYRRGVFDTLVTCRALDEGINVPETSVAIIASSTASIRQRIQRLGRILRPAPGKERAAVYTIYLTQVEEERLIREARDLVGSAGTLWMQSVGEGSDAPPG